MRAFATNEADWLELPRESRVRMTAHYLIGETFKLFRDYEQRTKK